MGGPAGSPMHIFVAFRPDFPLRKNFKIYLRDGNLKTIEHGEYNLIAKAIFFAVSQKKNPSWPVMYLCGLKSVPLR